MSFAARLASGLLLLLAVGVAPAQAAQTNVAVAANFTDAENGYPRQVTAIHFTQSIAELGRRVDELMKQRSAAQR